jgi:hypothetical protein
MSSVGVTLTGLDDLEASLAAVVQALRDPETAEAATRLVAASSRPLVPTDTRTLVQSERVTVTATGARLEYTARYSVIVQARQPWLGAGITDAVPRLVDLYETKVLEAWERA